MVSRTVLLTSLFLGLLAALANAYKIAVFTPDMAKSHLIWHKRVSETLAKAGHNVTIILIEGFNGAQKDVTVDPRVNVWRVKTGIEVPEEYNKLHSEMTFKDTGLFSKETFAFMSVMLKTVHESCKRLITNKPFMDQLKVEKFDLAYVQMYEACPIGLLHHAEIPTWIWLNAGQLMDYIAHEMGVPQPSSYVPVMMLDMKDEMTFAERMQNFIFSSLNKPFHQKGAVTPITQMFRTHVDPHFPDIGDLGRQCPLVMVNSNEMYDIPKPTLHKIINIGGLGMEKKDTKELTGEFKVVVDNAENIVIFSFGSIVNASAMPVQWKKAFMSAFSQFPDHEFIMRYADSDMDSYKPPNVHLFKWLPQSDLLQHPKTRGMISHGGYNTFQEAINAGKPIVMIPLFADQKRNGRLAEKHGFGFYLQKSAMTAESVTKALQAILHDASYTQAIRRMQQMVEKRPSTSEELLVKWTEFLAEFKELPNLVPFGTKLGFIQYHNIDVLAVLALVALALPTVFIIAVVSCCRNCRRTEKVKTT